MPLLPPGMSSKYSMQPSDVAQRLFTLTSEYLWSIGAAGGVASEFLSGARDVAQVLEVIPKKGDMQMFLNDAGEDRFPSLKLLSLNAMYRLPQTIVVARYLSAGMTERSITDRWQSPPDHRHRRF